ncbi:MAG: flagellar basal body L-ring protein FlgH, partial [Rhodospirillales bacterium]|nr:flagellar basal body L-ring protein FlgH [Rhodospirillales bacterium]
MYKNITAHALRWVAVVLMAAAISGCGSTLSRLAEVNNGPKLSKIKNPVARTDYRPVSMPMPAPQIAEDNPNSLWRAGARAFFKDTRAKEVGDILTVKLDLSDSATLSNLTERERDDSEDTDVTNLLGLEGEYAKKLPQGISPAAVISFGQ